MYPPDQVKRTMRTTLTCSSKQAVTTRNNTGPDCLSLLRYFFDPSLVHCVMEYILLCSDSFTFRRFRLVTYCTLQLFFYVSLLFKALFCVYGFEGDYRFLPSPLYRLRTRNLATNVFMVNNEFTNAL